jgi:hypothetical protein
LLVPAQRRASGDLPDHQPERQQDMIGDDTRWIDQPSAKRDENAPEGERTLSGEIIVRSGDQLWIQHMGVAVPMTIARNTKIDRNLSLDMLPEGAEVRVAFRVAGTENRAVRVHSAPLPRPRGLEPRP